MLLQHPTKRRGISAYPKIIARDNGGRRETVRQIKGTLGRKRTVETVDGVILQCNGTAKAKRARAQRVARG